MMNKMLVQLNRIATRWMVGRFVAVALALGVIAGLCAGRVAWAAESASAGSMELLEYRPRVEESVGRALAFLARDQEGNPAKDGSFTGQFGKTNAVVSLAAMAFLSAGNQPGIGPYGENINRCIDYVLAHADSQGYFGQNLKDGSDGGRMYSHGIATLMLSEASGMVDPARQAKIDAVLPKALKVILDAQAVQKQSGADQGGWRYLPTSADSDMSLTGWQIMALRSARMNGAPVPVTSIEKAKVYLNGNYRDKGNGGNVPENMGGFTYASMTWGPGRHGVWMQMPERTPRIGMTGVGLLCMELLGEHDSERCRKCGNFILSQTSANPTTALMQDGTGHQPYAIYYGTQSMHQLGGDYWQKFADRLYGFLLTTQAPDGSWAAEGYGTACSTAMYALALSVSYCQLPIYQR